jgi:hypothetical protein
MTCDLFVLAEGVTNDARGALTLVGINQRVVSPATLPFRSTFKAVVGITDEIGGPDGPDFEVLPDGELRVRVSDPSGVPQFAVSQVFKMPQDKSQGMIPIVVNIIADVVVSGDSYGTYSADISYRFTDGEEESRRFYIYVVPPGSGIQ